MLIATLTALYLLFFSGGAGSTLERVDRVYSGAADQVTAEAQAAEVRAALEEMREAAIAFEREILDLRKELFLVDADYDSTTEDYQQVLSKLDATWLRMQRRIVQLRYRMLGSMTREEWYAAFGTPEGE